MKKIICLFVLAATLFSCSSDDNATVTNSDELQKVIFYPDTPEQRQWNIVNGLLTTITLADGTVAEAFTYDSQNRVTEDVKYTNGVATETDIITYNPDNTINTINSLPYIFNATTRTYTYSYGSGFTINCVVNSDFLAVDFVRMGTNAGEYHMVYDSGNMTSFEKVNSGSANTMKNFHFDNGPLGVNPLYDAVLAVARVKSLTDPSFFIDNVSSTRLASGYDKGAADSNYYSYGIATSTSTTTTHNIKDFSIGTEVLDSSMNFVGFYAFAEYYYQ